MADIVRTASVEGFGCETESRRIAPDFTKKNSVCEEPPTVSFKNFLRGLAIKN